MENWRHQFDVSKMTRACNICTVTLLTFVGCSGWDSKIGVHQTSSLWLTTFIEFVVCLYLRSRHVSHIVWREKTKLYAANLLQLTALVAGNL